MSSTVHTQAVVVWGCCGGHQAESGRRRLRTCIRERRVRDHARSQYVRRAGSSEYTIQIIDGGTNRPAESPLAVRSTRATNKELIRVKLEKQSVSVRGLQSAGSSGPVPLARRVMVGRAVLNTDAAAA